jgi:hypothetical protein
VVTPPSFIVNILINLANKLIILGGMNNNNYLGSSILVLHLDINSRPVVQTEEEKQLELLEKNLQVLGHDAKIKLERLKKRNLRRPISGVEKTVLPEIK